MLHFPEPRLALPEASSDRVVEWTAQAHDLVDHPHLARVLAQTGGRWPSWSGRWGRADMTPGRWADRILVAVAGDLGELCSVTLRFPEVADELERVPAAKRTAAVLAYLLELQPSLGRLHGEWAPLNGWHSHGVVHQQDVPRLAAQGVNVYARDLHRLKDYETALRYAAKRMKKTAPFDVRAAITDYLLGLMAAMETTCPPALGLTFGV